ncbi:MAG: hypothetical protein QOJ09_1871 [Actinomycetota bacterium]|nr:hypothetical protein [Actinomycetota bacterium]
MSTLAAIDPSGLGPGFSDGWRTPLAPEQHYAVLDRADHVVLALDGEVVVGFATALSDGVLSAYIPLLEVLPSHRGRGIGTALIRRLLEEIGSLYMVDVMWDPEVVPFYARLGFTASGGGIIRNHR